MPRIRGGQTFVEIAHGERLRKQIMEDYLVTRVSNHMRGPLRADTASFCSLGMLSVSLRTGAPKLHFRDPLTGVV